MLAAWWIFKLLVLVCGVGVVIEMGVEGVGSSFRGCVNVWIGGA